MTSKNDITGDKLISKPSNEAYEKGWEKIFGKDFSKRIKEDMEKITKLQEKEKNND